MLNSSFLLFANDPAFDNIDMLQIDLPKSLLSEETGTAV